MKIYIWYVIGLMYEKWGEHGGKPKFWRGMAPCPLETPLFMCIRDMSIVSWENAK